MNHMPDDIGAGIFLWSAIGFFAMGLIAIAGQAIFG